MVDKLVVSNDDSMAWRLDEREFNLALAALPAGLRREVKILVSIDQDTKRGEKEFERGLIRMLQNPTPNRKAASPMPPGFGRRLAHAIKNEIYNLFCTSSVKYKAIRANGDRGIATLVGAIAADIAHALGIGVGVIYAAVLAILYTLLRMGRNAWCEAIKAGKTT